MHLQQILTPHDIVESSSLLFQKSLVVTKRGLASFPYDNEEDQRHIRKISRRRFAWEGRLLQLPHAPLEVWVDPLLSDELLYYLALGDYEHSHLTLIEEMVRAGDRVMNVGGGAGICAARLAQCAKTCVVVVEARKDLEALILNNLKINQLECQFVHGALHDDVPDGTALSMTVCDNLWFSSLSGQVPGNQIQVPSIRWETLMKQHTPDVVLLDIEGSETSIKFDTDHKPRVILMEIHTPTLGTDVTCQVIQHVIDCGYRVVNVAAQTWAFERRVMQKP